jgi:glycerophosphoryl diester phosphodiesterase
MKREEKKMNKYKRIITMVALSLVLCIGVAAAPAIAGDSDRANKIVIAHRGASGYLPEHTLEAYAMA